MSQDLTIEIDEAIRSQTIYVQMLPKPTKRKILMVKEKGGHPLSSQIKCRRHEKTVKRIILQHNARYGTV